MEVPGTTINCLYCQAVLSFSGLPAVRYADHLSQQHRILFRQVSCAGRKSAHKIQNKKLMKSGLNCCSPHSRMTSSRGQSKLN